MKRDTLNLILYCIGLFTFIALITPFWNQTNAFNECVSVYKQLASRADSSQNAKLIAKAQSVSYCNGNHLYEPIVR